MTGKNDYRTSRSSKDTLPDSPFRICQIYECVKVLRKASAVLIEIDSWRGVMNALAHILRTQGFLGLYRGHSLTLARTVPYAAIGYTMYDSMRKVLSLFAHLTDVHSLML